jgi:beta-lactam-binding protein with PASTA domain
MYQLLQLQLKMEVVLKYHLINKQIQFAESILEQRGLRYIIQYRPSSEANGSVLDQLYKGKRVKEGDRIPMGAVITLIVGQNDQGEPIPLVNFVGMSMNDAQYVMDTLGITSFSFVCPECLTHEDSISARIFSQTPEFIEGTTTFKSTQFTFSLKLGFNSEIDLQE